MPTPLDLVREEAEKYPEAEKAFLFGDHEVYRVKKKVFVWLGDGEKNGSVYVSVKLKDTQSMALNLPFVSPAGYGMAKWGWINAGFPRLVAGPPRRPSRARQYVLLRNATTPKENIESPSSAARVRTPSVA